MKMRITYLFDPLCGWCYGAGPSLERLAEITGAALELVPTGLFAGASARRMDARFAAFAWQNDERIGRLTGVAFSEVYRTRILGDADGLFDSAPATLGLIAVGLSDPGKELAALGTIQRARYVDGRDTTSLAAVADILVEAGFVEAARRTRMPDAQLLADYRLQTEAGRANMLQFGADGVPALLVGENSQRRLVHTKALFGNFDLLTAQLQAA